MFAYCYVLHINVDGNLLRGMYALLVGKSFLHTATTMHGYDHSVWVKKGDKQTKGTVVTVAATPRSYIVATPEGQLCRKHDVQPPAESSNDTELPSEDGNDMDDSNYQCHIQPASPIASRTQIKLVPVFDHLIYRYCICIYAIMLYLLF